MKDLINSFRNDWKRIVCPSKREVVYFSIMALALAGAFAAFFMLADTLSSFLVNFFLSI